MLHSGLEDTDETDFTKYKVKIGLQVFGESGSGAVLQEMKKMHIIDVGQPDNPNTLNKE